MEVLVDRRLHRRSRRGQRTRREDHLLLIDQFAERPSIADVTAMRVTVLGCSGSYAAPATSCTGYLVQTADTNVLLDCGPGVLANLQCHLPLERLDAVVL